MNLIHQTTRFGLTLALLLIVGVLRAETYEEICKGINETAKRQMTLQTSTRGREEKLAQALAKGTYDSPEMKETRARIEKLKRDLLEAEQTLKQQFEALPALQDEIRQSKESQKEIRKLDAQRRELIRKRDAFIQRHSAQPAK